MHERNENVKAYIRICVQIRHLKAIDHSSEHNVFLVVRQLEDQLGVTGKGGSPAKGARGGGRPPRDPLGGGRPPRGPVGGGAAEGPGGGGGVSSKWFPLEIIKINEEIENQRKPKKNPTCNLP